MRRRDVFKLATGAAMLATSHIARAQRPRTLKYVPPQGVTVLDPVLTTSRVTRVHGYLVFDTLYGLDQTLTARPQMIDGHTVENDGTVWTLKLRSGLSFHDGTPVLARDVVASIRRFGVRDSYGQALMAVTSELSAPDDRTLRFRLTKPFPHLPAALAGSGVVTPCIMPERLASTDPFRPVAELVGSGPYRFLASEFNAGERSTYERFAAYVPRAEGTASYTAGPKVTHFDRVEWHALGDSATAVGALAQGEVDWLDFVTVDQAPLFARNPNVKVEITEPTGTMTILRFNHLYPPFDNPGIRRAILGAIDQAEVMRALAGTDGSMWHDRTGLFPPGSLWANEVGIDVLSSPRDYEKVKRDLREAGYRGEPVTVLTASDSPNFVAIGLVGTEQLRRSGLNVDVQAMDFSTLLRRVASKEPREKGGWNVFFSFIDGSVYANPAAHGMMRGNGKAAREGWPDSPALEALRDTWLDTADIDTLKKLTERMQAQLWRDVPYIPMGHWVRWTAHRGDIVDLPWGFAAFYGVRRV